MNCKYSKDRKEAIIKAIRVGVPYQAAAEAAGVDRRTLYNWKKSNPDFAESLANATLDRISANTSRIMKVTSLIDRIDFEEISLRDLKEIAPLLRLAIRSSQWLLTHEFPQYYSERRKIDVSFGTEEVKSPYEMMLEALDITGDVQ